jgi:HEAT repeat protein
VQFSSFWVLLHLRRSFWLSLAFVALSLFFTQVGQHVSLLGDTGTNVARLAVYYLGAWPWHLCCRLNIGWFPQDPEIAEYVVSAVVLGVIGAILGTLLDLRARRRWLLRTETGSANDRLVVPAARSVILASLWPTGFFIVAASVLLWAVPPVITTRLVGRLESPDPAVRSEAIDALSSLGLDFEAWSLPPREHPVIKVQVSAMKARIEMAIPGLVRAVDDNDPTIRNQATMVLAQLRVQSPARAEALLRASRSPDDATRYLVLMYLSRSGLTGDALISRYLEALRDGNAKIRCVAAKGLLKLGMDCEAVIPPLVKAIQDSDKETRDMCVKALGERGVRAEAAVPALIGLLPDAYASEALGKIKSRPEVTVPALIKVLKQPVREQEDWFLREQAARALGEFGPEAKDALPALRDAVKEKGTDLAKIAAEAIRKIEK